VFTERAACELCWCTDFDVLYSESFASGNTFRFIDTYYAGRIPATVLQQGKYILKRCRACRFIWQGEILDQDNLALLYSHWIDSEASARKYAEKSPGELAGLVHQISALPFLTEENGREIRALDFGAGWGRWCQIAIALGIEAWAAELSDARLTHMRSLGIPVCTDILTEKRVFHFINAEQVLEHLPNPQQYFNQLASLLVPGGIMRISVPDGRTFENQLSARTWQPQKDAVHPLEHINCYTRDSLRTLSHATDITTIAPRKILHAYARCLLRGSGSLKTLNTAARSLSTGVVFFQKSLAR
jgi:2-polyprenyl-3-methyl-5-hydroxy-6-metoxy-1,4-benzoquinol methylase